MKPAKNYCAQITSGRNGKQSKGEQLLGDAVSGGPFIGLLIFTGENAPKPHELSQLPIPMSPVASWTARPWTTVVGNAAAPPVRL